ncbi:MAG TPA: ABC transporter substrate-binding protein [Candidatus Limnocylindrales bacterium]|nr:ABC transporter substrate-binding protein [Candidatus Limnocylindrales bacterium]
MENIKIGIGTSSIGRFLPYVGEAAGLFKKQDIAVEIINQFDEEKVVEDIASQVTPIGTPNAPSLIFSRLNGNDLIIIGGVLNRPAFYLVANSTIESIGSLKGKRVGINQPRRMAGMMMLALLRRWRLDRDDDLELVDLGLNDRSYEALLSGTLDAALLPPEKAFLAESAGLRIIADSLELESHWVPLATTRQFLDGNRQLVGAIAAIYRESIRLFNSDMQFALNVIGRQLPTLRAHPQVIEKCYRVFAELFEPSLVAAPASLTAVIEEVARQDARANRLAAQDLVVEQGQ